MLSYEYVFVAHCFVCSKRAYVAIYVLKTDLVELRPICIAFLHANNV